MSTPSRRTQQKSLHAKISELEWLFPILDVVLAFSATNLTKAFLNQGNETSWLGAWDFWALFLPIYQGAHVIRMSMSGFNRQRVLTLLIYFLLILGLLMAIAGTDQCTVKDESDLINSTVDCGFYSYGIFGNRIMVVAAQMYQCIYRRHFGQSKRRSHMLIGVVYFCSSLLWIGVALSKTVAPLLCFWWTASTLEIVVGPCIEILYFDQVYYMDSLHTHGQHCTLFFMIFMGQGLMDCLGTKLYIKNYSYYLCCVIPGLLYMFIFALLYLIGIKSNRQHIFERIPMSMIRLEDSWDEVRKFLIDWVRYDKKFVNSNRNNDYQIIDFVQVDILSVSSGYFRCYEEYFLQMKFPPWRKDLKILFHFWTYAHTLLIVFILTTSALVRQQAERYGSSNNDDGNYVYVDDGMTVEIFMFVSIMLANMSLFALRIGDQYINTWVLYEWMLQDPMQSSRSVMSVELNDSVTAIKNLEESSEFSVSTLHINRSTDAGHLSATPNAIGCDTRYLRTVEALLRLIVLGKCGYLKKETVFRTSDEAIRAELQKECRKPSLLDDRTALIGFSSESVHAVVMYLAITSITYVALWNTIAMTNYEYITVICTVQTFFFIAVSNVKFERFHNPFVHLNSLFVPNRVMNDWENILSSSSSS